MKYRIRTYEETEKADGMSVGTEYYTVEYTDELGEIYDLNGDGEPITDLADLSRFVDELQEQGAYGRDTTAALLNDVADLARERDVEDVCHDCGGRVLPVNTQQEADRHPGAQAYCERCGRWCCADGDWYRRNK